MNKALRNLIQERFGDADGITVRDVSDGVSVIELAQPTTTTRHIELDARATNDADTIELSFSSEAPVMVWGEREILSHHADDANFDALRDVGAILRNHDPDQIIGAPVEVWIDSASRKGKLKMRFGTTDIAERAKQEALVDKTLRGVSVGFNVAEWTYLRDENNKYRDIIGPAWVATKWSAREASLTPIPADETVGVGRNTQRQKQEQGSETMKPTPEELKAKEAAEEQARIAAEQAQRDIEEANQRKAKVAAEVAAANKRAADRAAAIVEVCTKHGLDPLPFVRSQDSLQDVYAKILDKTADANRGIEVSKDGRDSFRDAAVEGLQIRLGLKSRRDAKQGGEDIAGLSLMELARESLKRANLPTHGSKLEVAARALAGPRMSASDIRAFERKETISVGTSDFPYLLAAVANKTLLDEYAEAPTHYREWCAIGNVSDFKTVKRIEVSEIGELDLIPELAPYQTAKFSDKQEENQVVTFGKIIGISRQAVINDDLDGFSRISRAFARAAARLPQVLALKRLLANPVLLQDSTAVFAAGHGNLLTGSGYALDTLAHAEDGLRHMRGMLRKQRAPVHEDVTNSGEDVAFLNLQPKTVLVNADDEFIAQQAVRSAAGLLAASPSVVNPIASWGLNVIAEPNLANIGWSGAAKQWFMFADPKDAPVIEVVFLNGNDTPYMEEEDQTNVDGRFWKVRLDVGANAIGFRGAARADGA